MRKSILLFMVNVLLLLNSTNINAQHDVMLQGFYWDVPVDQANKNGFWYDTLSSKISELKEAGFTEIWLPPPSKGNWGITDMGYGLHDHYDLGMYDQIGTTETRFGSYSELENLIRTAHDTTNGSEIKLIADVILNHMYSRQEKDLEVNPVLKSYIKSEAVINGKNYNPYPVDEILWKISDVNAGSVTISLEMFDSQSLKNWDGTFIMEVDTSRNVFFHNNKRNYQILITNDSIHSTGKYVCQFHDRTDQLNYTLLNAQNKSIYIKLSAVSKNGDEYNWTDQAKGFYISQVQDRSGDKYENLEVLTTTGINYRVQKDEPNLKWNYSFFHPGYSGDYLDTALIDDMVTERLKWFGHDLNHSREDLVFRLADWGKWLRDSVGYDGYRFDFITGVNETFLSDWINHVWDDETPQATMVAEYFSNRKQRIYDWVNLMDSLTTQDIKVFDFPLKFELTKLCHSSPEIYDMRNLLNAGLLFDSTFSLPANRLVSFVDNHDTGKESDKWVTKNWTVGYAYILFAPSQPCVFYNHYFGDTQIEYNEARQELEIPKDLKSNINELMFVRRNFLEGDMVHISNSASEYKNLYAAYREGNEKSSGAFLTIYNKEEENEGRITLNKEYSTFFGKELINVLEPDRTVVINHVGEVIFPISGFSAGVWMLKEEYTRH